MSDDGVFAVGSRIRQLRIAAGLSMEQLANLIGDGTHFTTISKIERSQRTVSLDWVFKIAKALNVNPAELLRNKSTYAVKLIPVVGEISAGNWREAIESPIEMLPAADNVGGKNAFALRPMGDSMDKLVNPEAFVIVDPDEKDLLDGKLYAMMNGEGETTFKRYRSEPPRLEPVSTNTEHKPIALGREPFTVIGRVIWQMSPL